MHQSSPPPPARPALVRTLICSIVTAVLLALLPASAGAALPPIEGFPNYHAQTRCSPKAKTGTVMLARYLMRRYRGSGSLGISRSCRSGGVSEHKEGRAFDWALNVRSRRDRHYAASFLHRLRKRDRFGRRDALARRMGVMYVIWNDHIYSATYHYRKRPYLNAGCRRIRRCSGTLRHRDHMHISLTRVAAAGRTSWYSARRAAHARKLRHQRQHRRHHAVHHVRHHRHRAHHRHHVRHHRHRAHHRRHHVRHHLRHHRHRLHHRRHVRHHLRHHRHRARHHARHLRRRSHAGRAGARSLVTQPELLARPRGYDARPTGPGGARAVAEDWSNVLDWSEDELRSASGP